MSKKFYITTAIDYPNGSPHMGHALEKIASDAYARWHAFLGFDTYFVTGTDENGQKLIESAKALGQDTQTYVDENSKKFRQLCKDLNVSNNDSFVMLIRFAGLDKCFDKRSYTH
jgi:methionyl-tRNA synthetase